MLEFLFTIRVGSLMRVDCINNIIVASHTLLTWIRATLVAVNKVQYVS